MNYFIFLYLPIVMGPVRLKPNRTEPNRTVKPWCIQKYRKSFQQAGSDVNGDPYIPLSNCGRILCSFSACFWFSLCCFPESLDFDLITVMAYQKLLTISIAIAVAVASSSVVFIDSLPFVFLHGNSLSLQLASLTYIHGIILCLSFLLESSWVVFYF